jgi:hypothetical protein
MPELRSRTVTHGRMAGAFAAMATSADTGAVRDVGAVKRALAEAARRGAELPAS